MYVEDVAGPQATKQGAKGVRPLPYTYDTLNRVTQAVHTKSGQPTITETFVYDSFGNVQSVSNGDVTYTYTYDLKNRPISKTDSRTGLSLSYVYDYAGNVYSRTNYDGTTSEYRYDGADRLVGERNQDFLQVSYHYDPAGRLLDRILSNGSKTAYTYDNNNRLLSLKNTTANDTVINNTTYVRDRLGNITSQTEGSNVTAFTYDALYRLVNADYPGTANDQTYTYDHVGNRRTKVQNGVTLAYIYDAGNRLREIRQGSDTGPIQNSFVYDDDGNRIQKKDGSGAVVQSYVYDAKGRVKTITTSGVGQATQLIYDPYDYRIGKTDSTGTRRYLLEGEHLEATLDGSNNWKAMYLRGAVIDEIVNAYYFDVNSRWVNYTFHHDALQSVLGISGHEGSVLQTTQYGPFGDKINVSGSAPTNYLHYTGRETDPDTDLYNYRARLYDPSIGRFITEDPKGFEAGANFYTYCLNNPVNWNDPSGEIVPLVPLLLAAGKAVVSGGGNVALGYAIAKATGQEYTLTRGLIDFGVGAVFSAGASALAARQAAAITAAARVEQTGSIVGLSQVTRTAGHAERAMYEATQLSKANGGTTFLNRALSTTTGVRTTPNIRPDVLNIADNGLVNMVEVASRTDSAEMLLSRMGNAMS